jgi:hypothetical protein
MHARKFLGDDETGALIAEVPVNRGFEVSIMAHTDRTSELRGHQLGADDYSSKPVDLGRLTLIGEALLAGRASNRLWPKHVKLNDHETEVLGWVARGKTSAEIAPNYACRSGPSIFTSTMRGSSLALKRARRSRHQGPPGGLIKP